MADTNENRQLFKLLPFLQARSDAFAFLLVPPHKPDEVISFVIELEDYAEPDTFFDYVTTAVNSYLDEQVTS